MSSSRVGVAIDALVARITAVVAPIPVGDGSLVTNDQLQQVVVVGWDGRNIEAGGDYSSTTEWTQQVAGLGPHRRDETFGIQCCVISWTGDNGAKGRRDDVLATLALIENDLRADASLGLDPQPFEAEFQSGQLFQEPTQSGQQARIPFVVYVKHNRI
jgi:hypothetical protein